MAHFRFIFDELSYGRASEQNSTILIPLRKLIWCMYVVTEARHIVTDSKKTIGVFLPIYKFCFYIYSL